MTTAVSTLAEAGLRPLRGAVWRYDSSLSAFVPVGIQGLDNGGMFVTDAPLDCLSYVQVTDLSSAVALSPPSGAKYAQIRVESADARYRGDGVAPTASIGMPLEDGEEVWWTVATLADTQFIEQSASATLNIHYFGEA